MPCLPDGPKLPPKVRLQEPPYQRVPQGGAQEGNRQSSVTNAIPASVSARRFPGGDLDRLARTLCRPVGLCLDGSLFKAPPPLVGQPSDFAPPQFRARTLAQCHGSDPPAPFTEEESTALGPVCGMLITIRTSTNRARCTLHTERRKTRPLSQHFTRSQMTTLPFWSYCTAFFRRYFGTRGMSQVLPVSWTSRKPGFPLKKEGVWRLLQHRQEWEVCNLTPISF